MAERDALSEIRTGWAAEPGAAPDVAPARFPAHVHVSVSPSRVSWFLVLIAFGLAVGSLVRQVVYYVDYGRLAGSANQFSVDRETSIPTWFQSTLLLLCFGLLVGIAVERRRRHAVHAWGWMGLALTFLFLSVDEVAAIHDSLTPPLRSALNADGVLAFTWVVAGMGFCLVFLLWYRNFLRDLDRRTRLLFVAAGLVYVTGAVGMEILGSARASVHGGGDLIYAMLIVTVEEVLEMLGLVGFIMRC